MTFVSLAPNAVTAQERVEVVTANGMRFGSEWTAADGKAPVVLFFPMCWATPPETWAPVAAALKSLGVSSLVTTYLGAPGNSPWPGPQPPPEPQNVYWAAQFRQVIDAALAFVQARTDRPLVIAGASCGVERALDAAMTSTQKVAGVVVFAGAYTEVHADYLRSHRIPVLALTSRSEAEWVDRYPALVNGSTHNASRLVMRDEPGHGTVLFTDRQFAAEVAAWMSERLAGR